MDEFRQKLLSFLKHNIKCSASHNPHLQILDQACINANDPITTTPFAVLLKSESEVIAQKVQIYLPSHNPTCYKYNTRKSKMCRLDFLQPSLPNSEIDINRIIQLKQDNVWVNSWNPAIVSLIQSNYDINFRCQVDELDHSNIGDIDYIRKDIVSSWPEIIHYDGYLIGADIDMGFDYDHHKSYSLGHSDSSTEILASIIGEIEIYVGRTFDQNRIQPP